jgi:hypothetical protein
MDIAQRNFRLTFLHDEILPAISAYALHFKWQCMLQDKTSLSPVDKVFDPLIMIRIRIWS